MPDSLGQILQTARQNRKVSVEEAAQATRIRVHFLKALEEDRREALPSRVQGRGFLRNYAEYLGLNPQALLDLWDGKAPQPEPAPIVSPEAQGGEQSEEPDHAALAAGDNPTPEPAPVERPPLPPAALSAESSPVAVFPVPATPLQSQRIFIQIGQKLRQQRENLGLSLTEVERHTRVRAHYLQAIEAGAMESLPSLVQARGMLSNYARFLNLDSDSLLNLFADALQARRLEKNPQEAAAAQHQPRPSVPNQPRYPAIFRLLSMDLVVGGTLIVVMVGLVIWFAAQVMAIRTLEEQPVATAPSVAEVMAEQNSLDATAAAELLITSTVPADPAATPDPANAGLATEEPGDPLALEPTAEITGESEVGGSMPPLEEGRMQLYVVARQRVWMRVLADDREQFLGRTQPGNAYTFSGARKLEIQTGNAEGLQVYFNQTDLGSLGGPNEVVNMVFLPEGMVEPTPLPSPTPTRTPRVTPTFPPSPTPRPSATPQSTVPGPS